ncbi:DNA-processing protein DprA [Eionea flava]
MQTSKTLPSFFNTLLVKLLPAIGTQRYWSLIEYCQTVEQVLTKDPYTLPILNQEAKTLLAHYHKAPNDNPLYDRAHQIIAETKAAGATMISVACTAYPPLLHQIHTPPPLLFIKGNKQALSLPQLAIVGSRHATHQGLSTTALFAKHLANAGFTVTSGLALGVDSAAHQAVIDSHQQQTITGKTIAVMATGIDHVYPRKNHTMSEEIVSLGGALVTEFMPNTAPKAGHFPQRNRLISGLSLGTLVVEAAIKSGSLITAKYALEQNREVFAIPGSIHNPQSKGCHQLIQQGAHLVQTSHDIVEQLQGIIECCQPDKLSGDSNLPYSSVDKPSVTQATLSTQEERLLSYIGFDPVTTDQLLLSAPLPHSQINQCLLELEIKGWIKRSVWGYERV